MPALYISAERRLPNSELWENRFEVLSQSSGKTYIVAQHREKRHFACSCPAWTTRRKCKHLTAHGLPSGEVPCEVEIVSVGSFSLVSANVQTQNKPKQTAQQHEVGTVKKVKRAIRFEDE